MATCSVMNAHLRLASDRLHDGVQVISCDWRYLYVNETAAADGRRSAAALVGERMHDCYPGIEQTPFFNALERVIREIEAAANRSAALIRQLLALRRCGHDGARGRRSRRARVRGPIARPARLSCPRCRVGRRSLDTLGEQGRKLGAARHRFAG